MSSLQKETKKPETSTTAGVERSPLASAASTLLNVIQRASPEVLKRILPFLREAVPTANDEATTPSLNSQDRVLLNNIKEGTGVIVRHESIHGAFKHPVRFESFLAAKTTIDILIGEQSCSSLSIAAKKGADSDEVKKLLQAYLNSGHIKIEIHSTENADLYKINFAKATAST